MVEGPHHLRGTREEPHSTRKRKEDGVGVGLPPAAQIVNRLCGEEHKDLTSGEISRGDGICSAAFQEVEEIPLQRSRPWQGEWPGAEGVAGREGAESCPG